MTPITILFLAALLLVSGYAIAFGGRTGILGAGIFIAASVFTILADRAGLTWDGMNVGIVFVDAFCWLALLWLALHSGRYWPIWAAGLQLAAFLTHLSRLLAPDIAPRAYDALVAFWSLPILAIMLIGIRKDAHAGKTIQTKSQKTI
jgi:hypothetical protein